jgi:hypothetical protein
MEANINWERTDYQSRLDVQDDDSERVQSMETNAPPVE